jgi:pimeloyl-ACP methyl ester carboxylesterase
MGWIAKRVAARVTVLLALVAAAPAFALEPYGIALEGFAYPWSVSFMDVQAGPHAARLAYMDVAPTGAANGRAVLLFHGRNFPASYFEPLIRVLAQEGYRVIAPDQIEFGKSSKFDDVPVSFDMMATHMAALLDTLGLAHVDVIAHSMGNMAAVRFTRTFPARVDKLVMYGPVGLEDYRFYVPPVQRERLLKQESELSGSAYFKQLYDTYGLTLPTEQVQAFVDIRERMKGSAEWPRWVAAYIASFYAMWGQPVVHELPLVDKQVLMMVGTRDHTAPGKAFAPPELRDRMGHVAERAAEVAKTMPHARVEMFEGVGHLIHLEAPGRFNAAVLAFLRS